MVLPHGNVSMLNYFHFSFVFLAIAQLIAQQDNDPLLEPFLVFYRRRSYGGGHAISSYKSEYYYVHS